MGGLPTSTVNGFTVDPANPKIMYVGMRDGIFSTNNEGRTWTALSNAPRNIAAVAVNPRKPSDVYAVTTGGALFRSTDAGTRWATVH